MEGKQHNSKAPKECQGKPMTKFGAKASIHKTGSAPRKTSGGSMKKGY